ncbi:GntR family transcriptional regulator [soil metagenome]
MTLDERNSRPLYRQVADELRVQIQQRQLSPGRQLPTEANLMDRYGVSRNTVRLALGVLRTEGLVITGQGRGSFVTDIATGGEPHSMPVFQAVMTHDGSDALGVELVDCPEPGQVDVRVSTHPAPPVVADRLGLEAGAQVVARHRLLFRDAAPSHATDSFMPAVMVADTALGRSEPLQMGVARLLAEIGHPVVRTNDEIGVRMPSPAEAQELQIATGVPVLTVQRTAFDDGGEPVLTVTALLPGDRHVLRYGVAVDTDGVAASGVGR